LELRVCLEATVQLETVHDGHLEVEDDSARRLHRDLRERVLGVARRVLQRRPAVIPDRAA
jgi:hypothetical protein